MERVFSINKAAEILNISKETLRRWDNDGKLKSIRNPINNYREYRKEDLLVFENGRMHFGLNNHTHIEPTNKYKSIELYTTPKCQDNFFKNLIP